MLTLRCRSQRIGDFTTEVAQSLDQPDFNIADHEVLRTLVVLFARCAGMPFPVGPCLLMRPWRNVASQLAFLEVAISAEAELVSFNPGKLYPGAMPLVSPFPERGIPGGPSNDAWLCPDLVKVLLRLGETPHFLRTRALLDRAVVTCPEMLVVILATCSRDAKVTNTRLYGALLRELLPRYFLPPSVAGLLQRRAWRCSLCNASGA